MELFRAIPSSQVANAAKGLSHHSTMRLPSNVPYVVDNLWEWLRPQNMPSRRRAIYASPTPELALANASSRLAPGEHYVACRVVTDIGRLHAVQLTVKDAREHPDIKTVTRWVSAHGQAFTERDLREKQRLAPLFMPGLLREEVDVLRQADSLVAEVCQYFKEVSTFWTAVTSPIATSEGELFFELAGSSETYCLEPV